MEPDPLVLMCSQVVKQKDSGRVYALKVLNKLEMLRRQQTACFREERDVLVFGSQDWITTLHYAFQDKTNLYFVMDYYVGGDVLTLLSKYEDRLPEDMARFYATEMVVAIDSIHKLGYVHRDIKPDNVLIDKDGHIKLADFGSCLRMDANGKVTCTTAVGTPDYISPEILQAMEDGKGVYGCECDWWSLGVCLYEMLYGETPFYAESLLDTYGKIMQHKSRFAFPDSEGVSKEAKDIIKKLICDASSRLGQKGLEDFKKQPFFKDVDWDNVRSVTPPYIPEYSSPNDTRNFEPLDEDADPTRHHAGETQGPSKMTPLTIHLPFVGFTYTCSSALSDNPDRGSASSKSSAPRSSEAVFRQEKATLLQEIETLKKQLSAAVPPPAPQESAEMQSIVRTLERTSKSLKSEKAQLQEELTQARDQLAGKDKELREMKDTLRESREESSKLTDKLSELRSRKTEITRLVREKEAEIEEVLAKMESLRKASRETDKEKRAALAETENVKSELQQQMKLRQRAEQSLQTAEEELNKLKAQQAAPTKDTVSVGLKQEIERLVSQLAQKEADHAEAMSALQTKQNMEVKTLKEVLGASETANTDLQKENNELQLKLTRVRNQVLQELDKDLKERTERFEKEKQSLMDQTKELRQELEKSVQAQSLLLASKRDQETELRELRQNKELLGQWEKQIADIIQWVTEEKEARAYLKSVAKKLADDVETLKTTAGTLGRQKEDWMERRTLKRDKQELLELELSLKNEVAAKSKVQEQLTQVTSQLSDMEIKYQRLESEMDTLKKEKENLLKQEVPAKVAIPNRSDSLSQFFHNSTGTVQAQAVQPPPQGEEQTQQPAKKQPGAIGRESSHELFVKTFDSPSKCDTCTSVMFGIVRQGLFCKNCQMSCHVHCKDKVVSTCPLPPGQAKLPFGIDVQHGVGTACEGWIQVPKPGGVRKGWQRAYAIVCDLKIFVHEPGAEDIHVPAVASQYIFDIRDANFNVKEVTEHDVIHAGPKLIPAIFKVSCDQPGCASIRSELLILTQSQQEKEKWVTTLDGLHKAAKSSQQLTPVFGIHEVFNTQQLDVLKSTLSADIANENRLLIGDNEGLYMLDIMEEELYKFSEKDTKRVTQIQVLQKEGVIFLLSGKPKQFLRLLSIQALESGDVKNQSVKLLETEGASLFACGVLGSVVYVCVAIKNKVAIYELTPKIKNKYEKKKEISVASPVLSMQVFNEKLCVGYTAGFSLFHLYTDETPLKLVSEEDTTLGFIRLNSLPAMHAVEVNNGQEYLLCFNVLGIYVNRDGLRSRKQELLWHSTPMSFVHRPPYLLAFCESGIDVYDVSTSRWLQTLSARKVQTLSADGSLSLCHGGDPVSLLYLKKHMDTDAINLPGMGRPRLPSHIRKSTRGPGQRPLSGRKHIAPRSTEIGAPTQFVHVQHFGPYQPLNVDDMPVAGSVSSAPGHGPAQLPSSSASFHSFSALEESKRASSSQPRLTDQDQKRHFPRPITENFQDFSQ
eukprot:Em0021g526a